jgi:hypothetical protein
VLWKLEGCVRTQLGSILSCLSPGARPASETLCILTIRDIIINIQLSIYILHFIMVKIVFLDIINFHT